MSLFFYLFNVMINLWHRKFVTADVTAVLSNEDTILIRTHKYTQHTVTRMEELKSVHIKCNLFTFSSISAE